MASNSFGGQPSVRNRVNLLPNLCTFCDSELAMWAPLQATTQSYCQTLKGSSARVGVGVMLLCFALLWSGLAGGKAKPGWGGDVHRANCFA